MMVGVGVGWTELGTKTIIDLIAENGSGLKRHFKEGSDTDVFAVLYLVMCRHAFGVFGQAIPIARQLPGNMIYILQVFMNL